MQKLLSSPFSGEIFTNLKEWIIFFIFLGGVLFYNLFSAYKDYKSYQQPDAYEIRGEVKIQYLKEKNDKKYFVLKLQDSKNYTFYLTSFEDLKDITYRKVRVYGKIGRCSFWKFLKSCYFQAYKISLLPDKDYKKPLRGFIDKQHEDLNSAILYKALFFGDGVNLEWRNFSNVTGIAHLIAISGFHLGVLSGILFVLFSLFYRFFQKHYFTYRNIFYDLGFLVLLCMYGYLVFLDYQPAFFRAFLMALLGYVFYFSGVKILSFKMLGIVVGICLAVFPSFIFNIGFILSASGVFFILLFVKYIPKKRWWSYVLWFDICIFLLMGIVVHFYFPYFSPYQFVSILISLMFVIYFPVVLITHIFGIGGIFDRVYIEALKFDIPFIEFYAPWYLLVFYMFLCVFAIFSKKFFYGALGVSMIFYVFLFIRFLLR